MSRRFAGLLLLFGLLPTASAAVFFLSARYLEQRSQMALARALVLDGDAGVRAAREILARQSDSLWNGHQARTGLRLLSAWNGAAETDNGPPAPADDFLDAYPLPQMLRKSLSQRRYESSLRLIELARHGDRGAYPAFEAAALLELNRDQEARAVWRPPPGGDGLSAFETHLAQALELPRRGVSHAVHDRCGRLLGGLDAEGKFVAAPGILPTSIPAAAIDAIGEAFPSSPSRGVRLAMDLQLSRLAQAALGPYRGSIVVVDPTTGDVLAAVSDDSTWAQGGTPAFEQRREPASIAKLITTTAALRAGLDVDAEIADMRCRGAVRLNGRFLYCASISGDLQGLDHALAASCNVAFANLGLRLGRQLVLEEYERYGFAGAWSQGHSGAPRGESFGRILEPQGNHRQLADLAIGLEATDITPLHAAFMAAAVANHGVLPQPRLLAASDGFLGLSPRALPQAPGSQVLDPGWLPQIRRAMAAVVEPGGTAARVAPPHYRVAMKTGTGRDPGHDFHVNYIGLAPLPSPLYAFAVRITHQPTSRKVRRAAYTVTQGLLRALASQPSPRHLDALSGLAQTSAGRPSPAPSVGAASP